MFSFLTEAISLSNLRSPLYIAVKAAILQTVRAVAGMHIGSDIAGQYKHVFTSVYQMLRVAVADGFTEVISQQIGTDSTVEFKALDADGKAYGIDVELNDKYIRALTNVVTNRLAGYAHEKRIPMEQAANAFQWNEDDHDLIAIVRELIGVVIHELVHVQQAQKQLASGRVKREYRSYVEKDPVKFQRAMRAIKSGTYTDAEYVAYRASPQEITAFAHQIATAFIDDHGTITDQVIRREIPNYLERIFDNTDRDQHKAAKRLYKAIYVELTNYVEKQHGT